MSLLPFLHQVADRRDLDASDAETAMGMILTGGALPSQIGAFLVALRMKGESVSELVGFARAMRKAAKVITVDGSEPLVDTCGTGGDGGATFNISTVAAFVVAGAGVRVAKHGNRSLSSRCGAADLMESLGVRITLEPEEIARAIEEVGIGFLFAPGIHTAMKHAQPVRLDLKMRTVFNLLGPLTNPAGATAQLIGAPSETAAELMAGALAELRLPRGFVVHGSDGLDEVTTTGPTLAFELTGKKIERRCLDPGMFGVPAAKLDDLRGGDVAANREIALGILAGEKGPRRDIVLVNASVALVAAGRARDFLEGMTLGGASIDSGAAHRKLQQLVEFTAG